MINYKHFKSPGHHKYTGMIQLFKKHFLNLCFLLFFFSIPAFGAIGITLVTSSAINGFYRASEAITVNVVFSGNAFVSGGSPRLKLNASASCYAAYAGGSGTNTLNFIYTVQTGDSTGTGDLNCASTSALELNGSSINDSGGTAAALTVPTGANGLSVNKTLQIDTAIPGFLTASIAGTGNEIIRLTFTEPISSDPETAAGLAINDLLLEFDAKGGTAGGVTISSLTKSSSSSSLTGNETTIDIHISVSGNASGTEQVTIKSSGSGSIFDRAGNSIPAAGQITVNLKDTSDPFVLSVTSSNPDGNYNVGDLINITANISETVNVNITGGVPRILLETGSTDRYANYASGSGTAFLSFVYTVQAGDFTSDLDYTGTSAFQLNGATIRDSLNQNISVTLPAPGTSSSVSGSKNIRIDTIAPTITGSFISSDNTYIEITFSEGVYSDSNGSQPLVPSDFEVLFSQNAAQGGTATGITISSLTSITSAALKGGETKIRALLTIEGTASGKERIQLKAGLNKIFDSSGNPMSNSQATGEFWITNSNAPVILSVSSSNNDGVYSLNSVITITITFSDSVYVSGQPRLRLSLEDTQKHASYSTGTGSSVLKFTYTVENGDFKDKLAYTSQTALELNNGTITGSDSTAANLILPVAGSSLSLSGSKSIEIDARGPVIKDFWIASYNTYVEVNFSEPVFGDSGGTEPLSKTDFSLIFTKNGGAATGVSIEALETISGGALTGGETKIVFKLIIEGPDPTGAEYINISPVNSSSIYDVNGMPAPDSTATGAIYLYPANRAWVMSLISPLADGTYPVGTVIDIHVLFNEDNIYALNGPRLLLETGDVDRYAVYKSGNGSDTLVFTYTVQKDDFTDDLDVRQHNAFYYPGSAKITKGLFFGTSVINTFPVPGSPLSLSDNKDIKIDGKAPAIVNVTSDSQDRTYVKNEVIDVKIEFDEIVIVDTKSGNSVPVILLDVAGEGKEASYLSGTGSKSLLFRYTVSQDDNSPDLDYVSTTALALHGGVIEDAAKNQAVLTLPSPGAPGSLGYNKAIVIDTAAPKVIKIDSSTGDGTYGPGDTIQIEVTFNELVKVTNGTPLLNLQTGDIKRDAMYISGSSSEVLVFSYTVEPGDYSADLDYTSSGALNTNGAVIADISLNNADLSLPSPGAVNSLGNLRNIVIDGVKPQIISLDSPDDNKSYKAGSIITIEVRFNENVIVTGQPSILLETGSTDGRALYTSGSGTQTLVFKYTVEQGHISPDLDIASSSSLTLQGGSIADSPGNTAVLDLPAPGSATSLSNIKDIVIDTQFPLISDSSLQQTARTITITFSENVYTDAGALSGLLTSDFQVLFQSNGGGLTNVSVSQVTDSQEDPLAGGEKTVKLKLAFQGKPGGTETISIKAASGSAIYDKAGNPLDSSAVTASFTFAAEVVYVSAAASGNKTGISWTNAFTDLNQALVKADLLSQADGSEQTVQVWVKKGTYKPDNSTGNRQDTFLVKENTNLYGGFAGTETDISQRIVADNPSVLSGEINSSSNTDNSYHVLTCMNSSLVNGFTIEKGYADGVDVQKRYGGGVYISNGSVTLENCIIQNNFAKLHGGGVYIENSVPLFSNIIITGCSVESQGGGIYAGNCYEGTFSRVAVNACSSQRGGGIYLSYSPLKIENTLVTSCEASERGGGIYAAYYAPEFKSITVTGNTSPDGAGLFVQNNSPVIKGSIFWNNTGTQIKLLSSSTVISYSAIQGCGGSGASWNSDYGSDAGNNIQDDPKFLNPALPKGADRLFFTADDGCMLTDSSPCLNSSTSDSMPLTDITGAPRDADAGPDMGAYEGTAQSTAYVKQVIAVSENKTYGTGAAIIIKIQFSKAVAVTGTPQLRLNTGQADSLALYTSGTGSTDLLFTYTVAASDTSADLDYLSGSALETAGGTITDGPDPAALALPLPGQTSSLSALSDIAIDTQAPTISQYVIGGGNAYMDIIFSEPVFTTPGSGAVTIADLTALFSKNTGTATGVTLVNVSRTDGSPAIGGETALRIAIALTGTPSGAETLTIKASGPDTVYDSAGNALTTAQAAGPLNLINPAAPSVQAVTVTQGSGTYISGSLLTVAITFSGPVIITGTPAIALVSKADTPQTPAYASYSGGSNSNTITFNYTVAPGDNTQDLDYTSSAALELKNGTITSIQGVNASLILPLPGTAGSISASLDIIIDTGALTITSSTLDPANAFMDITFNKAAYTAANGAGSLQTSDFILTFNSNGGGVTQASINSITNTSGGALSGGETTVRVNLSYTGNPSGSETIKIAPATDTSIFDSAGNALALTQTTGTHTLNYAGTGSMPYISPVIPDLTAEKNFPITIDLTSREHDAEDGISGSTALKWHVTGLTDAGVTGENSDNDIITFTPQNNFTGYNECQLVLTDSAGNSTSQAIRVSWFEPPSSQLAINSINSGLTAFPGYPLSDLNDNFTGFQQDFVAKVPGITEAFIDIELPSDRLVSRISFFNDGQYGCRSVQVSSSLSDSPGAFTIQGTHTGLDVTDGAPRENIFHYHPFLAKHLRFRVSDFNNTGWLQLNEIKIYGWEFSSNGSFAPDLFESQPPAEDPNNTDKLFDGLITLNNDYKTNHSNSSVSITANLGADKKIYGFKIINDGLRGAKKLTLQAAKDSTPQNFIYLGRYKELPVNAGIPEEYKGYFPAGEYRYLKFTFDSFMDPAVLGLNEIVIYGESQDTSSDAAPLTVSGALSSMSPWPGYGTDKLFDNKKIYNNDFAVMNSNQEVSIKIDLGFDAQFTMIRHYNDGSYGAKSMIIETASDASSADFTLLSQLNSMTIIPEQPGQNVIALEAPALARYIRFTYKSFNHPSWLQINEIEILGPADQSGSSSPENITIVSVTSSKTEYPGYPASKLIDNKKIYNNDFALAISGPSELLLDLGSAKEFNTLQICNDGFYGARDAEIFVSDSPDSGFVSLGIFANLSAQAGIPVTNTLSFPSKTKRYIKLLFENYLDSNWFQLNELGVLNITGSAKIEHTLSSVICDTSYWPGYGPEKLMDKSVEFNRDFASRNNSGPVQLTLDLGSNKEVTSITLVNDGQYGAPECLIKTSLQNSPSTFTTLGRFENLNVSAGAPNSNTLDFTQTTCRFIKIEFYTFNDSQWFQLNEISVFGYLQEADIYNADIYDTDVYNAPVYGAPVSKSLPAAKTGLAGPLDLPLPPESAGPGPAVISSSRAPTGSKGLKILVIPPENLEINAPLPDQIDMLVIHTDQLYCFPFISKKVIIVTDQPGYNGQKKHTKALINLFRACKTRQISLVWNIKKSLFAHKKSLLNQIMKNLDNPELHINFPVPARLKSQNSKNPEQSDLWERDQKTFFAAQILNFLDVYPLKMFSRNRPAEKARSNIRKFCESILFENPANINVNKRKSLIADALQILPRLDENQSRTDFAQLVIRLFNSTMPGKNKVFYNQQKN